MWRCDWHAIVAGHAAASRAPAPTYNRERVPVFPSRPRDTTAEAERVQLALLRAAPVSRRLQLAWSLTAAAINAARRGIARAEPDASPVERDLRFVALHYGRDLADAVRAELFRRGGTLRRP
jgi:hypothetical protein